MFGEWLCVWFVRIMAEPEDLLGRRSPGNHLEDAASGALHSTAWSGGIVAASGALLPGAGGWG